MSAATVTAPPHSGALPFAGARIDRADPIRASDERLAAMRADPQARVLMLDGIDPLLGADGSLTWQPLADAPPGAEPLFLGLLDGAPCFALSPPPGVRVDARSRSAMRLLPLLAGDELALYGMARSLIDWHARHRFCAVCGTGTDVAKGGWARRCAACTAEHFPRVDPVVIMLAMCGDRALLARQPGFPPGFFSALAGFVEPGESIEDAVARELFEEAGIHVRDVRYVASQPWPFPSSLMIGCTAWCDDDALTLDRTELEAAMWVTRDEARAALAGSADARFAAPPPLAIARHLLEHWVAS